MDPINYFSRNQEFSKKDLGKTLLSNVWILWTCQEDSQVTQNFILAETLPTYTEGTETQPNEEGRRTTRQSPRYKGLGWLYLGAPRGWSPGLRGQPYGPRGQSIKPRKITLRPRNLIEFDWLGFGTYWRTMAPFCPFYPFRISFF